MTRSAAAAVTWFIFLLHGTAHAYPIQPKTLWDVTYEAELIVVAHVQQVRSVGDEAGGLSHKARLQIIETLKGKGRASLEVVFNRTLICPAPDVYEEGRTVLAFLQRYEGQWVTSSLSYGTRYAGSAEEFPVLRDLVRLALSEQGRLASHESRSSVGGEHPRAPQATLEWAVAAASQVVSRWDGLYAMNWQLDPLRSSYDPRPRAALPVSVEQLNAIAASFVRAPSFDHTLPMMLRLLDGHPDPLVTRTAVDAFETVLDRQNAPWWVEYAVPALARRLCVEAGRTECGSAALTPMWRPGECCPSDEERASRINTAWRALKETHGLVAEIRRDFQPPEHTATGGNSSM